MAHLRVTCPSSPPDLMALSGDRVLIGRSTECDLTLPDILLSRRHAELQRRADGWWARDLGSLNGTRVNGARLDDARPLRGGDVISLSDWRLEFREEDAPGARVGGTGARLRDVTELATRSDIEIGALARQNRVLGVLTRAAASLVATSSAEELLEDLLSHLLDAVPARTVGVAFLDAPQTYPPFAAARAREGPPPRALDPAMAERVRRVRSALFTPRVISPDGVAYSALCAPLWFSGADAGPDRLAGCVVLEAGADPTPFVEEDLPLVTAVANLASSRLESLRLREENADKRRLEEDVRGAARIQASLLPEETPSLPGWELAGSSRLCSAVGADYYDFALEGGSVLVALGDVAGKGLAAALLMAALRAAVRASWLERDPLPAIVGQINRNLCETVPPNRYATLLLARIGTGRGEIAWVNAGHAPPLLVRSGGAVDPLLDGGTILGVFPGAVWSEGRATIGRGDLLVLCSDGVFEAAQASGAPLDPSALAAAARAHASESAAAILAALQARSDASLGGGRRADDHTFLVVKRQA
jgi:sigma-B regulation protein RsbU (phosphoserine phosphatase)